MIYRTDYHTHTIYSDGRGRPVDYIPFAVKEGLSEIGFSDHLTLTDKQQDWSINPRLIEKYIEEIEQLKSTTRGISIKIGLEVDYLPGMEREIERITNSYPFDFILGSVHYMGHETVDLGPEYYHDKDPAEFYRRYFNEVIKAAATGLFDIMAHVDLIRIFRFFHPHPADQLYCDLASGIKKTGVAIEVNTNGRNKPLGQFYPDPDYLHHFANAGIPVCVNSDTHRPEGVGQYFDEAYALLLKSGYTGMSVFDRRIRREVPLGS